MLAHIAEVDARKLYLPAAYPSMFAYCVGELRLSEDSAAKRIQAARLARRFPAIFDGLAEGRLHLSGVGLLSPYLNRENSHELLAAATHRSKSEIERMLAERYPRPEVPAQLRAFSPIIGGACQHAPGHVGTDTRPAPELTGIDNDPTSGMFGQIVEHAPGHVDGALPPDPANSTWQLAPGQVGTLQVPVPTQARSRVTPLSPQAYSVQFTMSRDMHEKLRYAQELLSHQIPSGNIAGVLDRALDALIGRLEKSKFAATARPRATRRKGPLRAGHIPAHVKRAVWDRDGGQCTFVSESGHRCESRKFLEFDHTDEVARGGEASVGRMRLRCRAHNQFAAERTFGAEFMRQKRQAASAARAAARATAQAARQAAREEAAAAQLAPEHDVIPWLRSLGFSIAEARQAAAHCEHIPEAPLEQRVRVALSYFGPRTGRRVGAVGHSAAP